MNWPSFKSITPVLLVLSSSSSSTYGYTMSRHFVGSSSGARRTFISRSQPVLKMAGPGVVCASPDAIRKAMDDPRTTILDVRSVDEIIQNGYLNTNGRQYIHAQCTPNEAPLLSVAAEDLIRDKDAPVLVYCALGFRASKAKEVLESKGYTNVLNGGGITDLAFLNE